MNRYHGTDETRVANVPFSVVQARGHPRPSAASWTAPAWRQPATRRRNDQPPPPDSAWRPRFEQRVGRSYHCPGSHGRRPAHRLRMLERDRWTWTAEWRWIGRLPNPAASEGWMDRLWTPAIRETSASETSRRQLRPVHSRDHFTLRAQSTSDHVVVAERVKTDSELSRTGSAPAWLGTPVNAPKRERLATAFRMAHLPGGHRDARPAWTASDASGVPVVIYLLLPELVGDFDPDAPMGMQLFAQDSPWPGTTELAHWSSRFETNRGDGPAWLEPYVQACSQSVGFLVVSVWFHLAPRALPCRQRAPVAIHGYPRAWHEPSNEIARWTTYQGRMRGSDGRT